MSGMTAHSTAGRQPRTAPPPPTQRRCRTRHERHEGAGAAAALGGDGLPFGVELLERALGLLVALASTWRPCAGRSRRAGSASSSSSAFSAASAASISASIFFAWRCWFFDGSGSACAAAGVGAPPWPASRAWRSARPPRAPRARARTRASRRRRSAACRPRPRPCACRRRRAARGRGRSAAASPGRPAARPRAPRGSRGRGGWSARRAPARWRRSATRIASDSRRRSPPGEAVERLLGRLAAEQEAPEQRARLVRLEPRRALGGLEHGAAPLAPSSSACWESSPSLTLCPRRSLPAGELALAGERRGSASSCPAPLGPISETCSPRSSHSSSARAACARRSAACRPRSRRSRGRSARAA